jgi:hypothetical protein
LLYAAEPPVTRRYQVVRDNSPLLVYPRPCQQSQPLPNITLPRWLGPQADIAMYLSWTSTSKEHLE